MAKNDFLAFATGGTANVTPQAAWEQDPTVANGFFGGIAPSAKFNKAWRQAGFPGASCSEWVNQQLLTVPIPDDGNVQNWVDNFDAALAHRISSMTRLRITSPLDLYVDVNGNDNNNGLTPQTAWATLQHAWNFIMQALDVGGNQITVHIANGTYDGFIANGFPVGSQGGVLFIGNNSQPDNVLINATNGICIWAEGGQIQVSGMKLQATGAPGLGINQGIGLQAAAGGYINFSYIDFGTCQTGHMSVMGTGNISAIGPYSISGGGGFHCAATYGGSDVTLSGAIVTVNNNPNFSQAFIAANFGATMSCYYMTFSGTATGHTAMATNLAIIYIAGANPNSYFPGNLPAVVDASSFII